MSSNSRARDQHRITPLADDVLDVSDTRANDGVSIADTQTESSVEPLSSHADVLVVGGGPTGSAAATHAALAGFDTVLVDSQAFPRDKTCGDGLTPRAIAELKRLGLTDQVFARTRNNGLKLHGFGGSITAPWQGSAGTATFPAHGSAVPREVFDHMLLNHARAQGAQVYDGWGVTGIQHGAFQVGAGALLGNPVTSVDLRGPEGQVHTMSVRWLLVADGVRSTVGKQLGRTWHRDHVFGVAARSYVTARDDEWIHSHLELRDADGNTHPGYGWIFPLGGGTANVGCGALATAKRPAKTNVKKLLRHYAAQVQDEWDMSEPTRVTSALLPMGGAISNVSGPNWALLGDAACLVNPLNGEGIDYGMESARLAVELISAIGDTRDGLTHAWPALLRAEFGEGFSLARKLAKALTYPNFLPAVGPLTIGAPWGASVMGVAARLMGNLVTDEDRDLVARLWRASGRVSMALDGRKPWA